MLQALYEMEIVGKSCEEVLQNQLDRRSPGEEIAAYTRRLLETTVEHLSEIDREIQGVLENWDMSRIAIVDKNILRASVAELRYFPDVPVAVVISEAIEVGKKFSTPDSTRFINGVLDKLARVEEERSKEGP